jgi:hypothetical protein
MSESWWDEPLNMYSLRGDEELSAEEIDETLEGIEAETTSRRGKPTPICKACGRETRRRHLVRVSESPPESFIRPCLQLIAQKIAH